MPYTDPGDLTFATNENPLASAKLNQATNDQFLALFPDGDTADSWSPSLTATSANPAATGAGRQYQVGAMMHVWQRWTITGGDGGAGFWVVELPVACSGLTASTAEGSGTAIGSWTLRDNSLPSSASGSVILRASDEVWFNVGPGMLSATFPFLITTDDVFSFHAVYPVA